MAQRRDRAEDYCVFLTAELTSFTLVLYFLRRHPSGDGAVPALSNTYFNSGCGLGEWNFSTLWKELIIQKHSILNLFSGERCESRRSPCEHNPCGPHGRCAPVRGETDYECHCQFLYDGEHLRQSTGSADVTFDDDIANLGVAVSAGKALHDALPRCTFQGVTVSDTTTSSPYRSRRVWSKSRSGSA